jgi:hypothetical protein
VSVDGGGWSNPRTFAQRIAECEAALAELEKDLERTPRRVDDQAPRFQQELVRQIAEARAVLAQRKAAGE